jgi:formate hydrogenlyase subunit 3/multisubunit Na+/H+ antiporter MnhD subunit
MNPLALLLCVCWPILVAVMLPWRRTRGAARLLAPWAALPALLVAGVGPADYDLGWLMLGGHLGLDAIAVVLLPATAGLWLAAGLFAYGYVPAGPRRDSFFTWFLAAMAGNLLLLVALDTVVFYLGFALMSFASYGLVVHAGNARARHAGRYYIALVVIGEICVISALMLLANRGPIDFASVRTVFLEEEFGRSNLLLGLLVVGFGIKVGVVGLHFWLPLAHPVAPAPASAVLSGAMIKAGLVAWLRVLPLGEQALPAWGITLTLLGLFTAFYGVLAGLPQREAKTILAYSSVSQMGVMTLAIGLGLLFPQQWPLLSTAILIYMVHHCLVKGGLFLGAGLVQHSLGPVTVRIVAAVLALAALAMAGGPMTGGLVAKLALKETIEHLAEPWSTGLPLLLSISSAMTALLMLRFLSIAWPRMGGDGARVSPLLLMPWLALLLAWLAGPWLLAGPALRAEAAGLGAAWSATWPVALAALVTVVAVRLRRAGRLPAMPAVPPGDLGIPLERGVVAIGRLLGRACNDGIPRAVDTLRGTAQEVIERGPAWSARFGHGELRLARWSATGLLLVLLAATLVWLLA